MLSHWKVAVAVFLAALVAVGSRSFAQNDSLKDWVTVPQDQGGLVLIAFDIDELVIGDAAARPLDTTKWSAGTPLIRQIRLKPGAYQIRLKGPIASIGVVTTPGSLTYLRLGPYKGKFGEQGIFAVGWSGPATEDVIGLLKTAAEKGSGTVYATPFLQTENNVLTLNTEPPWPVPPPPKR
jgi:hypothetical protein